MSAGRKRVLDAASKAVLVDRAATHGKVERSFDVIGGMWSVLLGVEVTPAQVALMLGVLKVARAWDNPKHLDNWDDLAGYAACGGELAERAPDAARRPPADLRGKDVGR